MIVRMKHLTLLCVAGEKESALEHLRALGCVHVDLSGASSAAYAAAVQADDEAVRAVRIVEKAAKEYPHARGEECRDAAAILAADAERAALQSEVLRLEALVRTYAPFGDFDPELAKRLDAQGLSVSLAKAPSGVETPVLAGAVVEKLSDDGRTAAFAAAGAPVEWPERFETVAVPAERLSVVRTRLDEAQKKILSLTEALAASRTTAAMILDKSPARADAVAFAAAEEKLASAGAVCYLEGWVPQDAVPALRAKAVARFWGLALRDPADDETPPTLIRPPKLFRPVKALFEGLGIAPGYTEADVSVPFMCYFSLFFAMLVGDGAYGAIIFALTMFLWKKTKPAEKGVHRPAVIRSWLTLMTVFSVATIAWGALSNTWFGASLPFAADWPTVRWLAGADAAAGHEYDNMMFLCFTIGVSHLMIARIWNGVCRINSWECLGQFGWAGIVLFMYVLTNCIVGIFPAMPVWCYWMFGISFLTVFVQAKGMDKGMLFLNAMSVLGDIISYVRLFAVGLASVKVAQNFNAMALDLGLPIWIKWLPLAFILLVGHGLNFAMAGLSVLVHAVRLNTLEFSNHKGISWAGFAFRPFARNRG